jgi:hypothetical protein
VRSDKARRNRLICSGREVPEGWVVIGEHHSPACDGEGANALVIKRPGRREVVTADSPIPPGYRRVRETTVSGPSGDSPGWLIERDG